MLVYVIETLGRVSVLKGSLESLVRERDVLVTAVGMEIA